MKESLITILRNKNSTLQEYRQAADELGLLLAIETDSLISKKSINVETPLAKTKGHVLNEIPILVPILRSGLVLLPPFMRFYPSAKIGFIGLRRDETTAKPHLYYEKLPEINKDNPIFLLDPMIATSGSAILAVSILKELGAQENKISLISFIGSKDGVQAFQKECPKVNLIIAKIDPELDKNKRIIPGLGDFGDRYFGND